MCGICGIVDIDGVAIPDERPRIRMMEALRHRGPDSQGMFTAPGLSLGASRLSIIDREKGDQPVDAEGKELAVIHNGEIYNHRRLRRELEQLGHKFNSRCDTEVILRAFSEWGDEALPRFRGMFSFAIAGVRKRVEGKGSPFLLLARDPVGIKPLYYCRRDSRLLFASELRALLASGLVPPNLSRAGVVSYLRSGSVLEPDSLIEGVQSLPPGHCLIIREGKLGVTPFCSLQVELTDVSGDRLYADVRGWLEAAVAGQLESDEPPGIFLSGGLDSAVVAALAVRNYPSTLRTLSLSFSESEFDEASDAADTADFLGTRHHSIEVAQNDVLSNLKRIIYDMDQPTIDGVNTWWIAREARRLGIRTALSGLGGDELFAGYPTFWGASSWRRTKTVLDGIPEALRKSGYRGLTLLGGRGRYMARLPDFLCSSPFSHPYFLRRALFGPAQIRTLLKGIDPVPSQALMERMSQCSKEASELDPIGEISYLELTHYTLNRLLRDTDTMSMAHGLEVRVPLLDLSLVMRVLGVPGETKWKSGRNKSLLADACQELLPERLRNSNKKKGFTFPWDIWLRGDLGREVGVSLEKGDFGGVLDSSEVRRVWRDFLVGRQTWSRPWSLFVLKKWVERNL